MTLFPWRFQRLFHDTSQSKLLQKITFVLKLRAALGVKMTKTKEMFKVNEAWENVARLLTSVGQATE